MATPESVQELFERAVAVWSKPAQIRDFPSWKGHPESRALCEALAERIKESDSLLYTGLFHDNQHVVAYCLLALDLGTSARLRALPEALQSDERHVTIHYHSFASQVQMGELARKLTKKYLSFAHPRPGVFYPVETYAGPWTE